MQSKKTIAQSSTFSLSYCVQLIISSKNLLDLTEKITILGYLLFFIFYFSGSCDTDTPSMFVHFKGKCGNCKDGIHFISLHRIKAKRRRLNYGLHFHYKWFAFCVVL